MNMRIANIGLKKNTLHCEGEGVMKIARCTLYIIQHNIKELLIQITIM